MAIWGSMIGLAAAAEAKSKDNAEVKVLCSPV